MFLYMPRKYIACAYIHWALRAIIYIYIYIYVYIYIYIYRVTSDILCRCLDPSVCSLRASSRQQPFNRNPKQNPPPPLRLRSGFKVLGMLRQEQSGGFRKLGDPNTALIVRTPNRVPLIFGKSHLHATASNKWVLL